MLGLDPFRHVYELQERIGVQRQQAQLQKRIKVWAAVQLWASLYRKKPEMGEELLGQLGLADKRNAWFMTLSGGQKQRLFIASIVPTARFAQPIGAIIFYPMIGLSGLFVPIDSFPPALRVVARVLPLSHSTALLQGIWTGDS